MLNNINEDDVLVSNELINSFNDPLALKTGWETLNRGGASFRTCKLIEVNGKRLEIVPTVFAKIFTNIFLIISGVLLSFGLYFLYIERNLSDPKLLVFFIMGISLGLIPLWMRMTILSKKVFDKISGYFWKGNKDVREIYNLHENKNYYKLKNIHAIQVISEIVYTEKTKFLSYEMNLVFKDASRINILDHDKLKIIREEAGRLAEFLGIPVWDSTK